MINTHMTQYLLIKAKCVETGQTMKIQDLDGTRMRLDQRWIAEERAAQFAQKQSERTRQTWLPVVEVYTPSQRLR